MARVKLLTKRPTEYFECDWVICDVDTFFNAETKCRDTLFCHTFKIGNSPEKQSEWAIGITIEDGKLGLYLHLEKFNKSDNKEFICEYNVELGAPNEKFQPLISRSVKHTFTEPEGYGIPCFITVRELFSRRKEFFRNNALQISVNLTVLSDPVNSVVTAEDALQEQGKLLVGDSLANSFGSLLTSKKHSDITVRCGGRNFAAHKAILSARSPVFAAMLDRMTKEGPTDEITVDGVSEEAIGSVLDFLYTGRTNLPSSSTCCEDYLEIAERFGLSDLKTVCFAQLAMKVSDENAGDCALLAHKFNADKSARNRIVSYCHQNFSRLVKKVEFVRILKSNPEALISSPD